MSDAKTPGSESYSEASEENIDEEFLFYELTEEEAVYMYDFKKKKRSKQVENRTIETLKPKKKTVEAKARTPEKPKRSLKMKMDFGGGVLTKTDNPIYQVEEGVMKEALYFYDDDVSIANESIYETVRIEQDTIYPKGKEGNKETAISEWNEEERIGRYSDMEVDYTFGEKPYSEVYLEEVVTEGRLKDKKIPKKKPIEDDDEEQTATIEDIVFDDEEE